VLIARSIAGGKLYSQAMQTMRVIKRQQSRVQRALVVVHSTRGVVSRESTDIRERRRERAADREFVVRSSSHQR
jgi:hypothetical protein